MAVYTAISQTDLARLLAGYDIGEAVACVGITEGVENSNYKLTTSKGEFILTIYEKRVAAEDLPFFIGLMTHLAAAGYPCPKPIANRQHQVLQTHASKPLAIVSFLPGRSHATPTIPQCYNAGAVLAWLHLAAEDFPMQRANALGQAAWGELFAKCREGTSVNTFRGLDIGETLASIASHWPQNTDLPHGIIHADLFADNVLFADDDTISGVIDFYFACRDMLAYDLAIMLNAWCFDSPETLNREKSSALIAGYCARRQLTPAEWEALPLLAKGAAMRFFLTRLYDWDNTPDDAQVQRHDPMAYWQRLLVHEGITHPDQLRAP